MMPMNKRRYSKDFREQALSKVYSRPDEQNIDVIQFRCKSLIPAHRLSLP